MAGGDAGFGRARVDAETTRAGAAESGGVVLTTTHAGVMVSLAHELSVICYQMYLPALS